jgi:hypothetical protein
MGKTTDTTYEARTLLGSFCAAISVPLYFAGTSLLSKGSSDVYENIANKTLGLVSVASGIAFSSIAGKILWDDYKIFRKTKKC